MNGVYPETVLRVRKNGEVTEVEWRVGERFKGEDASRVDDVRRGRLAGEDAASVVDVQRGRLASEDPTRVVDVWRRMMQGEGTARVVDAWSAHIAWR